MASFLHKNTSLTSLDAVRKSELKRFCKASGLVMRMPFLELLDQALTHRSYCNELQSDLADNQRLEYLGDSVLGLVINEYLFQSYPGYFEGDLARIKSAVVAESPLARVARTLKLGRLLRLGRGEKGSGGSNRDSNLADALEAVVAAIYIKSGMVLARKFVLQHFDMILKECSDPQDAQDPKTRLQEFCQRVYKQIPFYRIVERTGPDHKQHFKVSVALDAKELGRGEGQSRKKAEQAAAHDALLRIEN